MKVKNLDRSQCSGLVVVGNLRWWSCWRAEKLFCVFLHMRYIVHSI